MNDDTVFGNQVADGEDTEKDLSNEPESRMRDDNQVQDLSHVMGNDEP